MPHLAPASCGRKTYNLCSGHYSDQPVITCRSPAGQEISSDSFADALYVARFRLLLAARLPAAGVEQDLQAMLADLHGRKPAANAAEVDARVGSIAYCANLHSVIAWLASMLSRPEGLCTMHQVLVQSDDAEHLQQRMKAIFAEPVHQQLLITYIQQHTANQPDYVAEVFTKHVCRVGLGAWTEQWATALRYVYVQRVCHM